ncbi:hydrophobin family protein [Aspergillus clavatus NRRL 1]|uniref:Hydrophobin n=1 Tax=Aspergillus clavatus (strain ATCC 1007 / CBS 513.65 / DSM 816 / NCTC 3887 / NRRL 1 / QM 1276 / 107) TaxID=344612 RepID=A1CHQ4_ASPCL|nr:fungal hydrophobin, putative [Aspergillus clavatus NRRL 1]EAW10409.1 fungal hydrophobin, putative [Aspergillus clavatus NRRL 1]
MKFALSIAGLVLAVSVAARPGSSPQFPILPSGMTVQQAAEKCGDQAQLSCCNQASMGGDSTNIDQGIAAGLLKDVLGGGSVNQGVNLFHQCAKLDLQIPIIGVPIQDALNQRCKQNVACCQAPKADASNDGVALSLPCIALGSVI